MEIQGFILDELNETRDELYNSLTTGEVDTFTLIKSIKKHIEDLDKIVTHYRKIDNGTNGDLL